MAPLVEEPLKLPDLQSSCRDSLGNARIITLGEIMSYIGARRRLRIRSSNHAGNSYTSIGIPNTNGICPLICCTGILLVGARHASPVSESVACSGVWAIRESPPMSGEKRHVLDIEIVRRHVPSPLVGEGQVGGGTYYEKAFGISKFGLRSG